MSPELAGVCAALTAGIAGVPGLLRVYDAAPWLLTWAWLALMLGTLGVGVLACAAFTMAVLQWRLLDQKGLVPEQERVP